MTAVRTTFFAFLIALASLTYIHDAKAQGMAFYDTAAVLEQFCVSRYDTDYGYCAGYITSIADVLMQYELYGYSACFSNTIKSQQLIDNVIAYLKNHPEEVPQPAKEVVARALATAFPCQN